MSQPNDAEAISLNILEREYKIACPANQRQALLRVATQLDQRMRQIKATDKLITVDRVAVLAALTIALESGEQDRRFEALSQSVDGELKRLNEQLANVAMN